MRNKLFYILMLVALSSPCLAQEHDIGMIENRLKQPEAIACHETTDCAVIRGACSEWTTVNTEYKDDADKYYRYMATMVECAGHDKTAEPVPSCETGKCTLPAVLDPKEEAEPQEDPSDDTGGSYE